MKRLKNLWFYATLFFMVASCASWQKGAKGVLDIIDALCIVAHQDLDAPAVLAVCKIAQEFIPDAEKLLTETKRTAALKKASLCSPSDAGVDAK